MSCGRGADVLGRDVAPVERVDEAAERAEQRLALVLARIADDDGLAAAEVESRDRCLEGHAAREAHRVDDRLALVLVRPHADAAERRPERGVVDADHRAQVRVRLVAEHDLLVLVLVHQVEQLEAGSVCGLGDLGGRGRRDRAHPEGSLRAPKRGCYSRAMLPYDRFRERRSRDARTTVRTGGSNVVRSGDTRRSAPRGRSQPGTPPSAEVGADVLGRGGNAVDAVVAMVAAGCVCEPTLTGVRRRRVHHGRRRLPRAAGAAGLLHAPARSRGAAEARSLGGARARARRRRAALRDRARVGRRPGHGRAASRMPRGDSGRWPSRELLAARSSSRAGGGARSRARRPASTSSTPP